MSDNQHTLKDDVFISGIGLHTGETVNLTIKPAPVNHWIQFKRTDVEGAPLIKADADLVVTTERGTTLEKKGVRIHTTEHLLAALVGLGIDNALVEVDGPEMPIMDGSSKPFIDAIDKIGLEEQEEARDYYELKENLAYEDLDKEIEMLAIPYEEFRATVMVDYRSPALGTQHAHMYKMSDFKEDISSCRTFVFLKELEALADRGLIKGGNIDNAIVLVERPEVSQEELTTLAKKIGKENLQVEVDGIGTLSHCKLKFENEPARHKLLDIIGDLALIGQPIKAHILAARPGHSGNVAFAQQIKARIKAERKAGTKHFDLSKEPHFDINDIEKMLPHRYPFLMVDKIMEVTENGIVGVKNITMNEPQFTGHFPGNPVMPGVLQIEAMAQVGGIFALSKVDEPEKYITYFMKIDKVKFKRKVIPGDTIVFDLELVTPIRRGIVHMRGIAYVNGEPATEAEMMAQIVKERD